MRPSPPLIFLAASLAAFSCPLTALAQSHTSTTATTSWSSARWNNTLNTPPFTSAYAANNAVNFTSGTYTFAGMGATINVGNLTVAPGVTVNFASRSGTLATGGSVRIIDVGAGSLLNLNAQAISTTAGTGFIKSGAGVFATGAGNFTGGFTLNAGTVVVRAINGLGSGVGHSLTLNGGTIASNANRSFANTTFPAGIVIGGDIQFGELNTVVPLSSSTANLSFANNINLGTTTRTFTLGNRGVQTFSGIISNTFGGLTFTANSNTTGGRIAITGTANTFTGDINITGGEARFSANGSLGNAANNIIIDGGTFGTAASFTLGATRNLSVGDGPNTTINVNAGTLTYNNPITNKTGETGSWIKAGTGTLALGGASTYSGSTTISQGTVRLTTGNNRLPTTTVLNLGQAASANLGTLNLNGRSQQLAGLTSIPGTNATVSKNTITSAAAATLTLNGNGNYSYGSDTAANSGVITGAIALVKTGTGTQTLGDQNTYTGGTTIASGSLNVINTAGSATGTGNLVVQNTATLLGSGRIAPANTRTITINNGGTVAIGDFNGTPLQGAKILTLTPDTGTITTTFQTGSTLRFDLFTNAGDNTAILSASDLFRTGGNVTFQTGVTLSVNKSGTFTFADGDKWRLLDWTTLLGNTPTGITSQLILDLPTLDPGLSWDVSTLYTNGSIAIIPEPSRTLFLALGLFTLTLRRRR